MLWKSLQKTNKYSHADEQGFTPADLLKGSIFKDIYCIKGSIFKSLITYSTLETMSNSQQNQMGLLTAYVGENWGMHSACSHNFSLGVFLHNSHTNN